MKGIIVVNKTDLSLDGEADKMLVSFASLGADIKIVRNTPSLVVIKNNRTFLAEEADFCVFLDKDIEMACLLKKAGVRVFNKPESIALCDDKMQSYIKLSEQNITLPDSCSLPLVYREPVTTKFDYEEIIKLCGRPFVLKENSSSLGLGVFLIKSFKDFQETIKAGPRYLAQKFIEESFARDLRVIVIGKKAVAWMKRENDNGDFRSGIASGGKGYAFEAKKEYIEVAEKCAEILDLDYCGVDLLFGNSGPVVAEVNSNALTKTLERVTGIIVTDLYAKYVLDTIDIESK